MLLCIPKCAVVAGIDRHSGSLRSLRVFAAHPDDLPIAKASANFCAFTSWSIRCDIGARSPLCPV